MYRSRIGDTANAECSQHQTPIVSADHRMARTEPGAIMTVNTVTAEERRISAPVWWGGGDSQNTGRGLAFVSLEVRRCLMVRQLPLGPFGRGRRRVACSSTSRARVPLRGRARHRYFARCGNTLARYFLPRISRGSGTADVSLSTSWSADGSAFSYWTHECLHHANSSLGATGCDRSSHILRVVHWPERRQFEAVSYVGTGAPWEPYFTGARFSPDGAYLMFGQQKDSPGDRYFVRRAR